MLDQLLNGEHNQLFDIVKNFSGVENHQNEAATTVVKESIIDTLTQQAKSGDLSSIQAMFSGTQTDANSPVAAGLSGNIVQNLIGKLGISPSTAQSLTQQILPVVLNMFNNKSGQAQNGGLDIASIIGQTLGGQGNSGSVDSLLNLFNNKDNNNSSNKDDGFGLDDMISIGKKLF